MQVASNAHLAAIVANPQWLEALNAWYKADNIPFDVEPAPFKLAPDSWKLLQLHLVGTGWFEISDKKINPNDAGRDFLVRINELYRSIKRETREDRIVTQILDDLPRGAAVDIGCGPGHSALRLARMGFTPVYAYDLSTVALEIAKALLENEGKTSYLYAEDATSLAEIETASLAVIYSRVALHYFNQRALARTINRALKPGGHLVSELTGLKYYLQTKHIRGLIEPGRLWKPLSYARTVLRTLIYEAFTIQPRMAAGAPEIGFTRRSIHRFARWAGLEIVSISESPSSAGGFMIVMRKPIK
jgi:SAM-dependent methyltransferase